MILNIIQQFEDMQETDESDDAAPEALVRVGIASVIIGARQDHLGGDPL